MKFKAIGVTCIIITLLYAPLGIFYNHCISTLLYAPLGIFYNHCISTLLYAQHFTLRPLNFI